MRKNLDDPPIFVIRNIDNYQSTILRLDEWQLWRINQKTIHFLRFPVLWKCITSKKGYLSIDVNLKLIFICENNDKDKNYYFTSLEMKHHTMSREQLSLSIKKLSVEAFGFNIMYFLNNHSVATSPNISLKLQEIIKKNLSDKHENIMLKVSNSISSLYYSDCKSVKALHDSFYNINLGKFIYMYLKDTPY